MERIKNTRQAVARRRVVQTPLTEETLAAFEKSCGPAEHVMVKRLIYTLRRAWERTNELGDELRREQELRAAERTDDKRPAAVVVLHCDGWCEVFADKTIDLHGIELEAWQEEPKETMRPGQREKYGNLLGGAAELTLFPRFLARPNEINQEALGRWLEREKRLEFVERFNELLGLLSNRVRNGAK